MSHKRKAVCLTQGVSIPYILSQGPVACSLLSTALDQPKHLRRMWILLRAAGCSRETCQKALRRAVCTVMEQRFTQHTTLFLPAHQRAVSWIQKIFWNHKPYVALAQMGDMSLACYVNWSRLSERTCKQALNVAARSGCFDLVKWLAEKHNIRFTGPTSLLCMLFCRMAREGNIEAMQWIKDCFPHIALDTISHTLLKQIITNGHTHVLEWMRVYLGLHAVRLQEHGSLLCNMSFTMLQWFHRQFGLIRRDVIFAGHEVTRNMCGHTNSLQRIQWLHSAIQFTPDDKHKLLELAVLHNHVDILDWLCILYTVERKDVRHLFMVALKHNHLPVLQWLHTRFNVHGRENAPNASKRSAQVFEWLHKNTDLTPGEVLDLMRRVKPPKKHA